MDSAVPKPIEQIRRERLDEFVGQFDRNHEAAKALGVEPGYLSQLKMGRKPGQKTGRNIGEKLARKMEQEANLPNLWFDGIQTQSVDLSADEIKLIRSFRLVSDEARQQILGWLAVEQKIHITGNTHTRERQAIAAQGNSAAIRQEVTDAPK